MLSQGVEASVVPSSGWTLQELLRQIQGPPEGHFLKPERVQEERPLVIYRGSISRPIGKVQRRAINGRAARRSRHER